MQAWLQAQLKAAFRSTQDPISSCEAFNEAECAKEVQCCVMPASRALTCSLIQTFSGSTPSQMSSSRSLSPSFQTESKPGKPASTVCSYEVSNAEGGKIRTQRTRTWLKSKGQICTLPQQL